MGFLTAALLIGAGSAAMGAVNAQKERKRAEAEMRNNRIEAQENAKLDQTREDPGADIVLGSQETTDLGKKKKRPARQRVTGAPTLGTTVGALPATSLGTAVGL